MASQTERTNLGEMAEFFPVSPNQGATIAVVEIAESRFSYSARTSAGTICGSGYRSEAQARAAGEAALARIGGAA